MNNDNKNEVLALSVNVFIIYWRKLIRSMRNIQSAGLKTYQNVYKNY